MTGNLFDEQVWLEEADVERKMWFQVEVGKNRVLYLGNVEEYWKSFLCIRL